MTKKAERTPMQGSARPGLAGACVVLLTLAGAARSEAEPSASGGPHSLSAQASGDGDVANVTPLANTGTVSGGLEPPPAAVAAEGSSDLDAKPASEAAAPGLGLPNEPNEPNEPDGAANSERDAPEVVQSVTARTGGFHGEDEEKLVWVEGLVEFRQLLVVDEDPAADRLMRYVLRGGVRIHGFRPFVRLELYQHFFPEPDEQFELRDTAVGVEYQYSLAPEFLGGRKLSLLHRGSLYMPTSRVSNDQDLLLAPELRTDARLAVIDGFVIGTVARMRYQWHRYADRAGPGGGYNTQLVLDGVLLGEYTALDSPKWGQLSVGADVWLQYNKHYPSRPSDELERAGSAVTYWDQLFGWDLYAGYSPPIDHLSFQLSIERGGRVLRDGIVNPLFFGHRDEIEFVLSAFVTY